MAAGTTGHAGTAVTPPHHPAGRWRGRSWRQLLLALVLLAIILAAVVQIVELLVAAVALVVAGALLLVLSARRRRFLGLPAGGISYSDTGPEGEAPAPLRAPRYRLAGRPDYLVRQGRHLIPVEVKTGRAPAVPYDSHRLQLGAYCLLVAENHRRPPHGILRYADDSFEIPYDRDLEAEVAGGLRDMRSWRRRRGAAKDDRPATLPALRIPRRL